MKKNRLKLLIVLMLLLSMTLIACGGGEEEAATEPETNPVENNATEENVSELEAVEEAPQSEAVPDEVSSVEDAPVAEDPPAEESGSPIADILQISEIDVDEGLTNYKMTFSMTSTMQDKNGEDVTQTIMTDIVSGTNPDVLSMNTRMEGAQGAEELGDTIMVQVDGVNYIVASGMGCIASAVDPDTETPFASLTDSEQILKGVNRANFEGEENINGVDTLHYRFDITDLTEEEAQDVENLEGDIYLAKEGGYLVRLVMQGEGLVDQLDSGEDQFGSMLIEYNITPIDTAVTVEIPAECAQAGAENTPYPVLDDAAEYNSIGGFISYTTLTSLEEALAFYEIALGADGWTIVEETSMYLEGLASYEYTKDGVSMTVVITANPDEGNNSVLIIAGE